MENMEYDLVLSTLNGDINAFSMLVSKYENSLYNFIYKMTFSKEDAEDILQEVFVRAYKNLYKYNKRWKFSTWIFRIAINSFKNEYKKIKKKAQLYCYDDAVDLQCSLYDIPDTAVLINENKKEFIDIINSLKFDQKTALCLRHLYGFSFQEVGEIMGVSPESAKMKVQRAKKVLKKKLEMFLKE